jgi:hypothetical protein
MGSAKLRFVSDRNPIQRINADVRALLVQSQDNVIGRAFPEAGTFCAKIYDDLKLALRVPSRLKEQPVEKLSDRSFSELQEFFLPILARAGITGQTAHIHSVNLAQRVQLTRAFDDPDRILERITGKVGKIIATFPRTAEDIECGRNPGDVIDPYILAATQTLLYQGDFQPAIAATVAHKALMIVEGLLGHLHEEVIGEMRGNVKAPEPRGMNQEILDPHTNPFPGADVVQPPTKQDEAIRLHQVKSKTGSAKGGDGRRLGEQLRQLRLYYGAEVFYDALIGNTLRGHRSMNAVLTAEPKAVVLVGEAAFRELTRSEIGPELLMRVYQTAFTQAAREAGYHIDTMAAGIVTTFKERSEKAGEGFLELLLQDSTGGDLSEQDSRTYARTHRRKQ